MVLCANCNMALQAHTTNTNSFPQGRRGLLKGSSNDRGGATVEASLAVPLALFFLYFILQLAVLMLLQVKVFTCFQNTAAKVAGSIYKEEEGLGSAVAAVSFSSAFQKEVKKERLPEYLVVGGKEGFLVDRIYVKDGVLRARLRYSIRLPIPFFSLVPKEVCEEIRQKTYSGYRQNDLGETYVYVTDYQSVYHMSRSCSHIMLTVFEISKSEREHKYQSYPDCSYCAGSGTGLYATKEGDCIHSSLACPGLKRTVRRVKKSEVPGLSPCGRCAGV